MSVAIANPVIVSLKQKDTAADKNYRVTCGFRPAKIEMYQATAAGAILDGVCLDTIVEADVETKHVGAVRVAAQGQANSLAQFASGGITLHDDGFTFGQNTFFKTNSVRLIFVIYRSTTPTLEFDLANVKTYKSVYGAGTQFKQDPTHSEPVAVYEV